MLVYCMEDIVVLVSNIPRVLAEIGEIAEKYSVKIPCFGHAGEGNIRACLLKENMGDAAWYAVTFNQFFELILPYY